MSVSRSTRISIAKIILQISFGCKWKKNIKLVSNLVGFLDSDQVVMSQGLQLVEIALFLNKTDNIPTELFSCENLWWIDTTICLSLFISVSFEDLFRGAIPVDNTLGSSPDEQ
jgi:hypothetical protein